MKTDPVHLLQLLHLNDSAFPTGGFSHSYGLETYTQAGIVHDQRTLREFLTGRLLDGMVRFDLVFVHEAHLAAQCNEIDRLYELDERLIAMMPVYELREASIQVGRRFLRTALPLYGGIASKHYFEAIQQKRCSGHFAIAYGVVLADMNIDSRLALLTYANIFVMGQAAAAVKLLNLGQTRIQALIAEMQPVIHDAVEQAITYTLDDCQMFTPTMDIRAMQHEHLFRRLFIS
jgi:urease accessory protein